MELKKLWAFFRKDFLSEASYRLAFALQLLNVLGSLLTFYFVDRLFGNRMVEYLALYGSSYFTYVLVGMAFFNFAGTGLGSLSGRIHAEQIQGTLEAILVTPIRMSTFLVSISLWNFVLATVTLLLYLVVATIGFQLDFGRANLLSVLVILALTGVAFTGLGLLCASLVLVFKRGNPLAWILQQGFSPLFSGVYFPISVFPEWLRLISYCLPSTYALQAMELAVHRNASLMDLLPQLGILCALSLAISPLGLWSFKVAFAKAKRDGSLGHY